MDRQRASDTVQPQVSMLGVTLDNWTMTESVKTVFDWSGEDQPKHVCFVNADCVNKLAHDESYRLVLDRAAATFPDGVGLKLAGKILGKPIRENVNGTDLFPRLCAALEHSPQSLYFLGGKPGVAKATAGWVKKNYPGTIVAGHHHGYFSSEDEREVMGEIRRSGASLLCVAFGAPMQEKWIDEHLHETGAKVAMGVGGLFDFYSGRIPRAPQWVREMGMEWLYRFYQEPRRMWRRYFVGNALFLLRVLKERLLDSPLSNEVASPKGEA